MTADSIENKTLWQSRLSDESTFCLAAVRCGYLTQEQMASAVQRFRLGRSRDGGVIFWLIDEQERERDGKIMYYRDDCHRDKHHPPTWVSALLVRHYHYPEPLCIDRCLFGLHQLALRQDAPWPWWRVRRRRWS